MTPHAHAWQLGRPAIVKRHDPPDAWMGRVSDQIVGVLAGGAVAIASGLAVALMTERRSRGEWRRQSRLASAATAIRALSALNREIATLAISDELTIDGTSPAWTAFHNASIEWNAARHEAALLAPQVELGLLAAVDREMDQVLEAAISKKWEPSQFRRQRARLGELASDYVRAARASANEGAPDLPSIWSWAADMDAGTRHPGADVPSNSNPDHGAGGS